MSQRKFSKSLKISNGHLHNMESGKLKKLKKHTSRMMTSYIAKLFTKININKINFKKIFETYTYFKKLGCLNTETARFIRSKVNPHNNAKKGLKSNIQSSPQNEFELKIFNLLKRNRMPFELHSLVKAKNKKVVVDFAIPPENLLN